MFKKKKVELTPQFATKLRNRLDAGEWEYDTAMKIKVMKLIDYITVTKGLDIEVWG